MIGRTARRPRRPGLRTTALRVAALVAALPLVTGSLVVAGSAVATGANAATAPEAAAAAQSATVTADALPTTQIDGVAWSQVVVGDTVYVAGSFHSARPAGAAPGTHEVPRSNLLAYNITTGELIDDFAPELNAQALALAASPDGSRLYVGGDFTTIDGAPHYRVAAFSTATGEVDPTFDPIVGSQVRALAVTADRVYLGGTFRSVNGKARTYLASVSAISATLQRWAPAANAPVNALARTTGSLVVVGGRFSRLAGGDRRGIGAVDATTGAGRPWALSKLVRNSGKDSAITSLTATADRVYGTGYVWSQKNGRLEGAFSANPTTGRLIWLEDCHGDSYSLFPIANTVYVASHAHECDTIGGYPQKSPPQRLIAFSKAATGTIRASKAPYFNFAGHRSPSLLTWFPTLAAGDITGQGQGAWSVAGNARYIVAGGEFPSVNGVNQAGLTRFAAPTLAPQNMGPHNAPALAPTAKVSPAGAVTLSWKASWDDDDGMLRYRVVRDGDTDHPLLVQWAASTFYSLPTMTFTDTTAPPGTHRYAVEVADAAGNTVARAGSPVAVVTGSPVVNEPPTARFSADAVGLAASFSAAASTDPDGAIASYSWDFGDGATATGVAVTHSYPTARTYPVTLTVRDARGRIGVTTRAVTAGVADATVIARDGFGRTVDTGWGEADSGGAWNVAGSSAALSVDQGGGHIALGAGSTRAAVLDSSAPATTSPVDVQASFAIDGLPTGTGANVSLIGRQVGDTAYTASAWLRPSGDVVLVLRRGIETLASQPVDVPQVSPGQRLTLRVLVSGVSPTTISARLWSADHVEPGQWMATATDSTPGMQAAGAVGVQASLSTAASAPITTTFDSLVARLPHQLPH